jgi:hypothetical protein
VMANFELADFERDRHLTLLLRRPRFFGDLAVTYLVVPLAPGRCRLLVKLLFRYRGGAAGAWLASRVFPWPELFMMRKQLLTLKELAEQVD